MLGIILALWVTLAAAGNHHLQYDLDFATSKTYVYDYEGLVLSGLQEQGFAKSGLKLKCKVEISGAAARLRFLKIRDIELLEFNGIWPTDKFTTSGKLTRLLEKQLAEPIKFEYHRGQVGDLHIPNGLSQTTVNLLRGVVNILQITIRQSQNIYIVQENGIGGFCNNNYLIQGNQKRNQLLITKSIDLSNCEQREKMVVGNAYLHTCANCKQRNKNSRAAATYNYKVKGTEMGGRLLEAEVKEVHQFTPFNEIQGSMVVEARQRLVLQAVQEQIHSTPENNDYITKESLRYHFERKLIQTPIHLLRTKNAESQINELLHHLVQHNVGPLSKGSPERFMELVQLLRMAEYKNLESIWNQFSERTHYRRWFLDAVPSIGNHLSLRFLKVKLRELSEFEAAQSVPLALHLIKADREAIAEAKLLLEAVKSRSRSLLQKVTYLAYGSLVYKFCSKEAVCPEEALQPLHDLLSAATETVHKEDIILALKSLGNAGQVVCVKRITKYIPGFSSMASSLPLRVQAAAVMALRNIAINHPTKVLDICLRLFMDKHQHPVIRMLAAGLVLDHKPPAAMVMAMAKSLMKEDDARVGGFVYYLMKRQSKSVTPDLQDVAAVCNMVTLILKSKYEATRDTFRSGFSYNTFPDSLMSGIESTFNIIHNPADILPVAALGRIKAYFMGVFTDLFEIGYHAEGLQELLMNRHLNSPQSGLQNQKGIMDMLKKLHHWKPLSSSEILASVYLKMFGQEMIYHGLNKNSLESILEFFPSDKYSTLSSAVKALQNGVDINWSKPLVSSENRLVVPTCVGLPLETSLYYASVTRAQLQAQAKFTPEPKDPTFFQLLQSNINLKTKFSLSMTKDIVFMIGVNTDLIQAGIELRTQVHFILPGNVEADVNVDENRFKMDFIPVQQENEVLSIRSKAFAITRNVEDLAASKMTAVVAAGTEPNVLKQTLNPRDLSAGDTPRTEGTFSAEALSEEKAYWSDQPHTHPYSQDLSMCARTRHFGYQVCLERNSLTAGFARNCPLYHVIGEHSFKLIFKPAHTEASVEKIQIEFQAGPGAAMKMVRSVNVQRTDGETHELENPIDHMALSKLKKILSSGNVEFEEKQLINSSGSSSSNSSSNSSSSSSSAMHNHKNRHLPHKNHRHEKHGSKHHHGNHGSHEGHQHSRGHGKDEQKGQHHAGHHAGHDHKRGQKEDQHHQRHGPEEHKDQHKAQHGREEQKGQHHTGHHEGHDHDRGQKEEDQHHQRHGPEEHKHQDKAQHGRDEQKGQHHASHHEGHDHKRGQKKDQHHQRHEPEEHKHQTKAQHGRDGQKVQHQAGHHEGHDHNIGPKKDQHHQIDDTEEHKHQHKAQHGRDEQKGQHHASHHEGHDHKRGHKEEDQHHQRHEPEEHKHQTKAQHGRDGQKVQHQAGHHEGHDHDRGQKKDQHHQRHEPEEHKHQAKAQHGRDGQNVQHHAGHLEGHDHNKGQKKDQHHQIDETEEHKHQHKAQHDRDEQKGQHHASHHEGHDHKRGHKEEDQHHQRHVPEEQKHQHKDQHGRKEQKGQHHASPHEGHDHKRGQKEDQHHQRHEPEEQKHQHKDQHGRDEQKDQHHKHSIESSNSERVEDNDHKDHPNIKKHPCGHHEPQCRKRHCTCWRKSKVNDHRGQHAKQDQQPHKCQHSQEHGKTKSDEEKCKFLSSESIQGSTENSSSRSSSSSQSKQQANSRKDRRKQQQRSSESSSSSQKHDNKHAKSPKGHWESKHKNDHKKTNKVHWKTISKNSNTKFAYRDNCTDCGENSRMEAQYDSRWSSNYRDSRRSSSSSSSSSSNSGNSSSSSSSGMDSFPFENLSKETPPTMVLLVKSFMTDAKYQGFQAAAYFDPIKQKAQVITVPLDPKSSWKTCFDASVSRFYKASAMLRWGENCQDYKVLSQLSTGKLAGSPAMQLSWQWKRLPSWLKSAARSLMTYVPGVAYTMGFSQEYHSNPSHQVTVRVAATSPDTFDTILKAPEMTLYKQAVPIPGDLALGTRWLGHLPLIELTNLPKASSVVGGSHGAECQVDLERIVTFDGKDLGCSLSPANCYTVIAQDCTNQLRFLIAMRKMGQDSSTFEMNVILGSSNIKIFSDASEEFRVLLNGMWLLLKNETYTNEKDCIRIHKNATTVTVKAPKNGVEQVSFNGQSAQVQLSPLMHGKTCGLCGNSDRHRQNDFQKPNHETARSCVGLVHSWMVPENSCGSSCALGREYIMLENELIEEREWTCYSAEPVLTCVRGCHPAMTAPVTVAFHCLPKESAMRLEDWQANPKVSSSEDLIKDVEAHTSCVCTEECAKV